MSINEKAKTIHNKIKQNKAQYNLDKLLRFLLYCQEMLVSMNF